MKSFIFALLMLLSVCIFITVNACKTTARIDEMLSLTEILPKNEDEFKNQTREIETAVMELTRLWEKYFPSIAFTAGYENTNRCDEAIGALEIHFANGNGEDFTVSLSEFCDAISRVRMLEGFHWQGIF